MLTYVGKNDEGENIFIGTIKEWEEYERKLDENPTYKDDPDIRSWDNEADA